MTKKSQRVTLQDVALLAGVGSATVDRVINDRGNVSNEVRRKVLAAARDLGLKRILPSSYRRTLRVHVVLARPERPLIPRINDEFRRLGQRLGPSIIIQRTILKHETPESMSAAMLATGFDAVVVANAPDDPLTRRAICDLAVRNVPVVTIISDIPGSEQLAYAGIDHYKAGRSTGFFLDRMTRPGTSGKVIVLCFHQGNKGQSERIRGLTDQFAADASDLTVAEIAFGGDDAVLSEMRLKDAFRRHPDTACIYNVGAGNRGVVAAIRAGILREPPIFIGHELTNFTWHSLKDGVMTLTIDQSPELQTQYAIEVLMNHFGFEGATHAAPPYVSNVPIVLYGPQNLPDQPPG
ncbi:MAG: LacI family DNA-binding transcriptional regulator [Rhodobacterales bacterium]|nr:LacI family DNA-binding transcriptional regulator [Rhodobacterales bacterium]